MDTLEIGKVKLDLTHYTGEDLYSEGDAEDAILEIVKTCPEEEFDEIIRKNPDWPTLYHLSSARGNIVSWIPFTGKEKVLEIGSGLGALTGVLSSSCAQVDCVELSKKRSTINAYRHKDCSNITIYVGNFEDLEPDLDRDYDYIFLIGVLEYAGSFLHCEDPYREELYRVFSHINQTGRVVIAIENRLGLKYFAGCAEDHSGKYFDGIESYSRKDVPARTFTRPALENMLVSCGAQQYSFYYPYPDYKFMTDLYSDQRLPYASELSHNIRNFDQDRLLLFDEQKAYRGITEDGLYPLFANSYEIVVGPMLPVVYCKFSNDRARQYQIRTQLNVFQDSRTGEAIPQVRKYPMTRDASYHVEEMEQNGNLLMRRYPGYEQGGLIFQIAPCKKTEDGGVEFPYVEGISLERLLDERLNAGDGDGFVSLLRTYESLVGIEGKEEISDYDMTFSNILINGNVWTAIDYEWAVKKKIPAKELLIRSLLVYDQEDDGRSRRCDELFGKGKIFSILNVSEEEVDRLSQEEEDFQNKVTGGVTALGELRSQMGKSVIKPSQLQSEEEKAAAVKKKEEEKKTLTSVQIYYDMGSGYKEEESLWIDENYGEEGMITFVVHVPGNARQLRIDPAICPCVVLLRNVIIYSEENDEGKEITAKANRQIRTNGNPNSNGSIIFTTSDPWMEWKTRNLRHLVHLGEGEAFDIRFTIQLAGLPSTMAKAMEEKT